MLSVFVVHKEGTYNSSCEKRNHVYTAPQRQPLLSVRALITRIVCACVLLGARAGADASSADAIDSSYAAATQPQARREGDGAALLGDDATPGAALENAAVDSGRAEESRELERLIQVDDRR